MSEPKLWVPPRVDKEPHFFCRICKTQFITEKAMEHHVVKCGNDDTVAELRSQQARNQPFFAYVDPEWEAHNAALRAQGINPEVQYNRGRKSNIKRASES